MNKPLLLIFLSSFALHTAHGQTGYFYPSGKTFNKDIPTPEEFLGYPIGTQHTRHEKVIEYIKTLDRLSDKMTVREIGYSYEHRQQVTAIITSPENQGNLEAIRIKHLARGTAEGGNDVPLVIQLGYNVHGNEPSSTEAALLTAYYLVANEDDETKQWLSRLVILLDPVYNPDGRDRHTHWANMHKGTPFVADPMDREHNEVWPGGRGNHYWFDLNRDWLLGVHPESRNRMTLFHEWRPYVMTDHHEMGTNSTFYFDPGKYISNNPIVPAYLYDTVYPKFGEYFAQAMDAIGSQYFSREGYDKLYPGYGSSYVNFYGGIGFLFEQASSRGHLQQTTTVPLTFAFTIRNQTTASLATVRASLAEKEMLLKLRRDFYKTSAAQAKANPIKAYVFGDSNDPTRTNAFANFLLLHKIELYDLDKDVTLNGKRFEKNRSFIVPTDQENYMMVRTAFEKEIVYRDSIFYDATTWSVIHAMGLPSAEIRGPVTKGNQVNEIVKKAPTAVKESSYAYLMELTDYNSHRAIHQLQSEGVIVRTAFKPFTAVTTGGEKKFGYGSLVISVQQQSIAAAKLFEAIQKVSKDCGIDFHSVNTGFSQKGIDLGSASVVTVRKPKALMLMGAGVVATEAGEVWHLLDQRVNMPITKVDIGNLARVNLNDYNTLIMVSGTYTFEKAMSDKIKVWVQGGGTLISFKTASEWVIKQGLCKEKLLPIDTVKNSARIDFANAADTEGAKQLSGAIFEVDLDVTNPIGFGFTDRKVAVYRNGKTFLQPGKSLYVNVAQYTANPLIGGYLHKSNAKKIANSAAILLSSEGQGRVILFSDNPNFRGIWYGTNKLFLNALFFGSIINPPAIEGAEE